MTTQISLSLELIYLINWLLKNEKPLLNSVIKQALQKGLAEKLDTIDKSTFNETMYETIVDFLDFLESSLLKQLENTINVDNNMKDTLWSILQKIELENLDSRALWTSMKQTKARVNKTQPKVIAADSEKNSSSESSLIKQDTEAILFEELLKNWRPNNNETVN